MLKTIKKIVFLICLFIIWVFYAKASLQYTNGYPVASNLTILLLISWIALVIVYVVKGISDLTRKK